MTTKLEEKAYLEEIGVLERPHYVRPDEPPVSQPQHHTPWAWIAVVVALVLLATTGWVYGITQHRSLAQTQVTLTQVRSTLDTAERARDTAIASLGDARNTIAVGQSAVYDLLVCAAALSDSESALVDGDLAGAYKILVDSGQPEQCQGAAAKATTFKNAADAPTSS